MLCSTWNQLDLVVNSQCDMKKEKEENWTRTSYEKDVKIVSNNCEHDTINCCIDELYAINYVNFEKVLRLLITIKILMCMYISIWQPTHTHTPAPSCRTRIKRRNKSEFIERHLCDDCIRAVFTLWAPLLLLPQMNIQIRIAEKNKVRNKRVLHKLQVNRRDQLLYFSVHEHEHFQ